VPPELRTSGMGRAVILCERHVKNHVDALIAGRVSCQVTTSPTLR
jgi:hypothetical protein